MGTERTLTEAWEDRADQWSAWAREPGHDSYWRFHRDAFGDLVRDGLRMTFESWHRPLRDYFAALEGIGMLTEAVREPQPLNGGRWDRVPLFVELRAVRP